MFKHILNTAINPLGNYPVTISLRKTLSESRIRYILIQLDFWHISLNSLSKTWYSDNSNGLKSGIIGGLNFLFYYLSVFPCFP